MHRDKTVARMLLIFSIANVALAAPAVVQERNLDVAGAASEKRAGSDHGSTDGSMSEPMPELESSSDTFRSVSEPSEAGSDSGTSHYMTDFGSFSDSSEQDLSRAASFHEGPAYHPEEHASAPVWWYVNSDSLSQPDSAPASPTGSLHHNSVPEVSAPVAAPSAHDDPPPVSEAPPSRGAIPMTPWWQRPEMAAADPWSHLELEPAAPAPAVDAAADEARPDAATVNEARPDAATASTAAAPEADKFFNAALKHKIKVYAGAGAVVGVSVGLAIGAHKLIKDHSHRAYVSAFLLYLSCRPLTEPQTF